MKQFIVKQFKAIALAAQIIIKKNTKVLISRNTQKKNKASHAVINLLLKQEAFI